MLVAMNKHAGHSRATARTGVVGLRKVGLRWRDGIVGLWRILRQPKNLGVFSNHEPAKSGTIFLELGEVHAT
jgi:hypothetical protein